MTSVSVSVRVSRCLSRMDLWARWSCTTSVSIVVLAELRRMSSQVTYNLQGLDLSFQQTVEVEGSVLTGPSRSLHLPLSLMTPDDCSQLPPVHLPAARTPACQSVHLPARPHTCPPARTPARPPAHLPAALTPTYQNHQLWLGRTFPNYTQKGPKGTPLLRKCYLV